jgi:hypothetical protein
LSLGRLYANRFPVDAEAPCLAYLDGVQTLSRWLKSLSSVYARALFKSLNSLSICL